LINQISNYGRRKSVDKKKALPMINLTLGNATYDSIFIVREPRMLHQEKTHKIWDIRFLNQVMDAMADGVFTLMTRSGFKTPSKAQWLRCRSPVNAHIPRYAALS
jgi:hypothetical protein